MHTSLISCIIYGRVGDGTGGFGGICGLGPSVLHLHWDLRLRLNLYIPLHIRRSHHVVDGAGGGRSGGGGSSTLSYKNKLLNSCCWSLCW